MEGLTKYIFFPLVKLTFIIYAHIYELQRWQKCSKFKWNQEAQPKSFKQSFIIDYLSILVSVKIIINMLAVLIRIKPVLIWWPSLKLTYLFYSMNTTLIRGTYNYNFFHLIRNLIPGTKQIYLSESSSSSSSDTLHSGSSSRSTIMASISGTAISLIIWSLS